MKDKGLVIGAVILVIAIVAGVFFIARPKGAKAPAPATAAAKPGKARPVAAKRPISKDMGGLIVKLQGAGNRDLSVRVKAFKAVDSRSSVLVKAFTSNAMQELLPGTYDIEVETMPATIYKGIKVNKGRESIEDLGRVTGTVQVKAMTFAKQPAKYPVRVLQAKTNVTAAMGLANKPIEVMAGVYDIEIASFPKQVRKDVKIVAGKDVSLDVGDVGMLLIRTIEPAGKEVRGSVRVRKAENNELIASTASNKPIDILPGTYIVECLSNPPQKKDGVQVKALEDVKVEFVVQPPAPRPVPSPAPKPVETAPVKKPGA